MFFDCHLEADLGDKWGISWAGDKWGTWRKNKIIRWYLRIQKYKFWENIYEVFCNLSKTDHRQQCQCCSVQYRSNAIAEMYIVMCIRFASSIRTYKDKKYQKVSILKSQILEICVSWDHCHFLPGFLRHSQHLHCPWNALNSVPKMVLKNIDFSGLEYSDGPKILKWSSYSLVLSIKHTIPSKQTTC